MTTQLIPVVPAVIGSQTVQTVDGRTLHTFLEVETRFNDWIERRIDEYGFEADKDFYSVLSKTSKGRPSKDYALTLDMAKELSMVERNAKGKQARQYFIECERLLLTQATRPQDPLATQLAELLKDKVLVDYGTLWEVVRTMYMVTEQLKGIAPLMEQLENQCGKLLVQDLIAMMAKPTPAPESEPIAAPIKKLPRKPRRLQNPAKMEGQP